MAFLNCLRIRDGIQTPKLLRMHWAGHIICPNLMGNCSLNRNRNLFNYKRDRSLINENNMAQRALYADTIDYKTQGAKFNT